MKKFKIKDRKEFIFLLILISIFFVFGIYLIFRIEEGIAPDEGYHIHAAKVFSKTILIPENLEENLALGDITREPYLAHWLNGRVLNLNFIQVPDYIILRFFNLAISVGSLLVVYLISKEIINKKYFNLIPVFLLSNTLMFAFLSSAVSYDNLSNFLIYLTFYFLIKHFKYKDTPSLIYLIIFQSLSTLTKITALPVVFIEVLILIYYFIKSKDLKSVLEEAYKRHKVILVLMLVSLLLVFLLYGVNLIKYGQIQVSCDKVMTVEQCMNNFVYSRNRTLENYTITNFSELKALMRSRLSPIQYFFNWLVIMFQSIHGVHGHTYVFMDIYMVNIYIALYAILTFITIRKWKRTHKIESRLILITLFYTFILLFFKNYSSYIKHNYFRLALQGRYIFPVLPIIYILFIRYLSILKSKWLKLLLLFILCMTFLLGGIPYFFSSILILLVK
ncbi:MAG: hypothetical protein XD93_0221 [candidate division WS6 bacterium 34_10]|uniref:Uncharacterized protein n=1 Tax=candidate division WS6 bacterium 34_10 TaxID=1641389 RepID=A0A101HIQ0_9BACT|nr:MAG: hypothetical protein XD93_0221 [candidate division WS6 bacterium 34_10]